MWVGGWFKKSLKTPLRNIKMAPTANFSSCHNCLVSEAKTWLCPVKQSIFPAKIPRIDGIVLVDLLWMSFLKETQIITKFMFRPFHIYLLILTGAKQDKSTVEISQDFAAFSEYMNFISLYYTQVSYVRFRKCNKKGCSNIFIRYQMTSYLLPTYLSPILVKE